MSDLQALQNALAAEHAAVYGYGVVGAHLDGRDVVTARSAFNAHLAQRDRLASMISAMKATPVAAEPAYSLPFAVNDAASSRALALVLEDRSAAVYAEAVAESTATVRHLCASSLYACAARGMVWRGQTVALPGLPDHE